MKLTAKIAAHAKGYNLAIFDDDGGQVATGQGPLESLPAVLAGLGKSADFAGVFHAGDLPKTAEVHTRGPKFKASLPKAEAADLVGQWRDLPLPKPPPTDRHRPDILPPDKPKAFPEQP